MKNARLLLTAGLMLSLISCRFDNPYRWLSGSEPPECAEGELACRGGNVDRCLSGKWQTQVECISQGGVCNPQTLTCADCIPNSARCQGLERQTCNGAGRWETQEVCDETKGFGCEEGRCEELCGKARKEQSNVGCEYWAADLDNAFISPTSNAAGQQFAVVVSNPSTSVSAHVKVSRKLALGAGVTPTLVAEATLAPRALQVFRLGPLEIDGSGPGEFNTGTGTALTPHAFRIASDFPIIAYQFNPLDNVSVFSNDASLLKPKSALGERTAGLARHYVVSGWPQTIADTSDPNTDFNPNSDLQLRAFLTVIATEDDTQVEVVPKTDVVAGGPIAKTPANTPIAVTLNAFDVLNLETGDFLADFTGSEVKASAPIAVFSGAEATDAPTFETVAARFCCADHIEEQLDPLRTLGKTYLAAHQPKRTQAVVSAGAQIAVLAEPEFVRVIATEPGPTEVKTNLPPPDHQFMLGGAGEFRQLTSTASLWLEASEPVAVSTTSANQEAAGIPRGLPGGDPSFLTVPPIAQWRNDYVFLVPENYAFDFLTFAAPPGTQIQLDNLPLDTASCSREEVARAPEGELAYVVFQCPLSKPTVFPDKQAPANLQPGEQADGVHRVVASQPIGLFVSGFDNYVSYAYAAGTNLRTLQVR